MRLNHTSAAVSKLLLFILLCAPTLLFSQDEDTVAVDTIITEETYPPPFQDYFPALTTSEISAQKGLWNTSATYSSYTSIPNQREIDGGRVSDPDDFILDAAEDSLTRWIIKTEEQIGFQIAVVMVNSIGAQNDDPHFYATDLFNHWGIGDAESDNGLLIFVVNDIHNVSTITGRGTEAFITDAQTSTVHDTEMIPFFREDDYTTGIVRGVQVYIEMLYDVPPAYLQNNYSSEYESDYDYDYGYEDEDSYHAAWYERPLVSFYLKIVGITSIVYLVFLLISFFIKDLHKRYHTLKFFTLLIFPILMPFPFLPLYFLNRKLMEKWRNTERFSPNTGEFMVKLSEAEDDEYLKKGQVKEEVLKSIDYDVWITPSEENDEVLILRYKRWFTKYRKCPKCRFKTYNKDYDRVISAATYSSSGTGERKYSCKNCGHSKITRYTIPKKVKSSSSSGGSSYSSGGSSYSGGGGSSYGGGSSRGGGSSSSW